MKKHYSSNKGFIQIPVLFFIITGIIITGGAGYFGVKKYENYHITKGKEKVTEEIKPQKDIGVEKLTKETGASKDTKPDVKKGAITPYDYDHPENNLSSYQPKINGADDSVSVIKKWKPRVAYIDCKVVFNGNNMGEQTGSGYLLGYDSQNGDIIILTNLHIIKVNLYYPDGEPIGTSLTATSCDIKIPGDTQFVTVYKEDGSFTVSDKEDFAQVTVKNPTPYMTKTIKSISGSNCISKAELGERILILGYPGIGDQNDITVTDGIISGYDGNHYITSAKIEYGNSGGIAISLKNNCYLGIPTFVISGELESLARILNVNAIFPN
ncbi:MAG TPA: trypsin-like peptidase domain-containing protein [Candidatus Paceibacterota bacterium]